ncbi:MAG TPA: iron-sulfur cluster assembly accessory protein [Balneolaceae bacterium]|nr:iron-sulfur cluster assembly accessory protein [Balneolaceae bacterium]
MALDENLDSVIADLVDSGEDDSNTETTSPFEGIDLDEKAVNGPPVSLTERAAGQVQKIMEGQESDEKLFLRVAVEGGGCSGLSYKLGLDYKKEADSIIESCGVEIVVEKKHMVYLKGISIDYPDGLDARGFTFDNPNADETCGCGSSFAT